MNFKTMYNACTRQLSSLNWLPPLLARLTLGVVFIESGWGKLHNLEKVTQFFQSLGIPAASIQAPFVAGVELIAGALVLIGLLTRISSVLLMGVMFVAIITAKLGDIQTWSDLFGFSEYLYMLLLLWLVIAGAGKVSIDNYFNRK